MLKKIRQRLRDMKALKDTGLLAEKIANAMGDSLVGAEHWVLAALELPDGSARRVFEHFGADATALKNALEQQYDDALKQVGIDTESLDLPTEPPITEPRTGFSSFEGQASTEALFAQMADDGPRDGPYKKSAFMGATVIYAASKLDKGALPRAFEAMGIDRKALRTAAAQVLDKSAYAA